MELGRSPPPPLEGGIRPYIHSEFMDPHFLLKFEFFQQNNDGNMKSRIIFMIIDIQIKS